MIKKLILAYVAITSFAALVAVSPASASPILTEGGSSVAVGSSGVAENTGLGKFTASALNVECTSAEMKGILTKNSGTKIAVEVPVGSVTFAGTGASTDCTSQLGATKVAILSKLCGETGTSDNVVVTGCGSNIVFTLSNTGVGSCKYSDTSVPGTFLTNSDATVSVVEHPFKLVEGGIFCPAEGKLDLDVDLVTTSGTTLLVS